MKQLKARTPRMVAQHMIKTYGKEASTHTTYNLMQYDRGTPGYNYWLDVLNQIDKLNAKLNKQQAAKKEKQHV